VKHHDCMCSECRQPKVAPRPSSTITIPLAAAPAVIADSARTVLHARRLSIVRYGATFATALDGSERDEVLDAISRDAAQALCGLDKHFDQHPEEPAPAPRARGRR
jgi:hypothetical protein